MNPACSGTRPARQNGFTIMELLIVIVIVSILAALAVPSYREYVMRTHRTVAKVALQDVLARQESYAVDHKRYATNFGRLGIGADGNTSAYLTRDGVLSATAADAIYQLTLHEPTGGNTSNCSGLPAATSTGARLAFRVSAAPTGTQSTDTRCMTLCLSSTGDRGSSAGVAADCWRR